MLVGGACSHNLGASCRCFLFVCVSLIRTMCCGVCIWGGGEVCVCRRCVMFVIWVVFTVGKRCHVLCWWGVGWFIIGVYQTLLSTTCICHLRLGRVRGWGGRGGGTSSTIGF